MKKITTGVLITISWIVFLCILYGLFWFLGSDIHGGHSRISRFFAIVVRVWDFIDDYPSAVFPILFVIVSPVLGVIYIVKRIRSISANRSQKNSSMNNNKNR